MSIGSKAAILGLTLIILGQVLPLSAAVPSPIPGRPNSLLLTLSPPKLPSDGGSYQSVVVSLTDSKNLPTLAASDITVFLSSSLTNIASVPNTISIGAGKSYAVASVTTTTTPGSTMITAHAEGLLLASGNPGQLTTITPSGFPSKLRVLLSPSVLLPRTDSGSVWIELLDEAGHPAKAVSDVNVLLTSSNNVVATLGQTAFTIPAGSLQSAGGTFSTSTSGVAVLTATASGYTSGAGLVTVVAPNFCNGPCVPTKVALKLLPGALPADGNSYNALEVSLATSSGAPALSATPTLVMLTSDKSALASVPGDNGVPVTIPAGSLSVLAPVATSALSGVANITATSPNLASSAIGVKMIIPAPSKLQVYISPPKNVVSSINPPILVVQLQDSTGNPARARQDTTVIVTSSNQSLINNYISLKIPAGKNFVSTSLSTKGVGTSVLTATSQGLVSSQAPLVSVVSPLVVKLTSPQLTTSNSFIYSNQSAKFTFTASFEGAPLRGLNVTWTVNGGSVKPSSGTTSNSGTVTTTFTPPQQGSFNITARGTSASTGAFSASFIIGVTLAPLKPAPTLIQQVIGFWYLIVIAVVAAAIVSYYLLRRRRKKQKSEIEAGFEAV